MLGICARQLRGQSAICLCGADSSQSAGRGSRLARGCLGAWVLGCRGCLSRCKPICTKAATTSCQSAVSLRSRRVHLAIRLPTFVGTAAHNSNRSSRLHMLAGQSLLPHAARAVAAFATPTPSGQLQPNPAERHCSPQSSPVLHSPRPYHGLLYPGTYEPSPKIPHSRSAPALSARHNDSMPPTPNRSGSLPALGRPAVVWYESRALRELLQ